MLQMLLQMLEKLSKSFFRTAVTMWLALLVFNAHPSLAASRKVVIFYSSIGSGHLIAAKGIQSRILNQAPDSIVVLKNIRDFMSSELYNKVDERIFWYLVKNQTNLFDQMYKDLVKGSLREPELLQGYKLNLIAEYLDHEHPDAIISTHYGSAISLSSLRAQNLLKSTPVAWLHTDYTQQFLPRISNSVDMTFLPHQYLEQGWLDFGVSPEKVKVTGMPVKPELFAQIDTRAFLISQNLNPDVRTVVIASGAEGVGDYELVINQLSQSIPGNLQIVAVCGKNTKMHKSLLSFKPRPGVTLVTKGFIPSEQLFGFVKSTDLYITKAGGLSPTEAFVIGVPTVIMDVYRGHESDNANLFEKLNLAVVNRNLNGIGAQSAELLKDDTKIKNMLTAQSDFRDQISDQAIVDFALHAPKSSETAPGLGTRDGVSINLSEQALEKLEYDSPADLEILYSEGISPNGDYGHKDANRFGHIAIRVGPSVYTINQNTGTGQPIFTKAALHDYLYATKNSDPTTEIGSHFGVAYSRNSFGLRIDGLQSDDIAKMESEIQAIESEWSAGKLRYSVALNNCSDITERILSVTQLKKLATQGIVGQPRDLFENLVKRVDLDTRFQGQLVTYTKVPGAKNYYAYASYPVSLTKPKDLLLRKIGLISAKNTPSQVVEQISKRLTAYPSDPSLHYENVTGTSIGETVGTSVKSQAELQNQLLAIQTTESQLQIQYEQLRAEQAEWFQANAPHLSQPKATGPPNKIQQFSDQFLKFETLYDQYTKAKLKWLLDRAMLNIELVESLVAGYLPLADRTPLFQQIAALRQSYEKYKNNENLYNQAKDVQRIDAFREFMDQQKKIYAFLEIKLNPAARLSEKLYTSLLAVNSGMIQMAKILPILPKLLNLAYDLKFSRNTEKETTPVVNRINQSFKALGDQFGFKVEVRGKENIPALNNPKTINFFMLQHSHPQLDNVVLANLNLGPYAIYGAIDTFAPKVFADQMNDTDHFIAVGRGADLPIQKTLEILSKDKVKNFVIYPEGSVSVGAYDMRAPRPKFVYGLLRELKAHGYTVNLIPISMPNNFRFNNEWMNPVGSEKTLQAFIGKPFSSEFVDQMVGSDQEQIILQLIRMTYFNSLLDHSRHPFFGTPQLKELDSKFDCDFELRGSP